MTMTPAEYPPNAPQKQSLRGWLRDTWPVLAGAGLRLVMAAALLLASHIMAGHKADSWLSHKLKGPDAIGYQAQAMHLAKYLRGDIRCLKVSYEERYLGYPAMLAIVYALTLPEPAMGVLLNCLAFLGAGLLARRMALLFGAGRKGALLPAVLVVLWPPSLLYSPILLKDSLAVFAAFLFITPLAEMVISQRAWAARVRPFNPWALMLISGLGFLFLINLRPDYSMVGLPVGLAASLLGLAKALPKGNTRGIGIFLLLAVMVVGLARFAPAHSLGHYFFRAAHDGPADCYTRRSPTPSPPGPGAGRVLLAGAVPGLDELAGSWDRIHDKMVEERRLLNQRRWQYARKGGMSMDESAHCIPYGLEPRLELALQGLRNLFLFPYPWQQWPLGSGAGWLGIAGACQSVLWYLLIPGILVGLAMGLKRNPRAAVLILLWVACVGGPLMLAEVNLGTLYRHRDVVLLILLPLLHAPPYRILLDDRLV